MNIGIFTDTYLPEINGVAVSIKMLKDELTKLGHNVYIITTDNPGREGIEDGLYVLPSMALAFIPSRRLGTPYSNSVRRAIKTLNIEIVHTHSEFSIGLFGKLNAFMLSVPLVHTYHTIYKDYGHYLKIGRFTALTDVIAKIITKSYCSGCCALIVPTKKTYDLLNEYKQKNEKYVIPTGINLSKFDKQSVCPDEVSALKEKYNLKAGEKTLIFIGRIAKEKSIDVIIRAFPRILEISPGLKLVVVGDGPSKDELMALCAQLGIMDKVVFTGEVPWDKIASYYKLGDAFINASRSETQGLTYIEAMASGLPVIARRDECLEGIVIDKETGFIFESECELPGLIGAVLSDEEQLMAIKRNALSVAQKYYSANYAKSVLEVYDAVLEKGRGKPRLRSRLPGMRIRRIFE